MRRKKHTEKEVHAHLISVVSVRLREGYTIREISLTKGKHVEIMMMQWPLTLLRIKHLVCYSLVWRRDSTGGEAGAAMETQHAHRVPRSRLLAAWPFQANHQGRGDDGGELWHPAWHQLHPEETHHQPVPHVCHPPLLEHTTEVLHGSATQCDFQPIKHVYCYLHVLCVPAVSTRLIKCWCTSNHSTQFLRTTWFLRAPKTGFLCFTSLLAPLLRYVIQFLHDLISLAWLGARPA